MTDLAALRLAYARAMVAPLGATAEKFGAVGLPDLLMRGPVTSKLGARHGKTGAQVSLKYLIDQGMPFVFKSSSLEHATESADMFGWELAPAEMEELGLPFYYCENTEGGHAAGANLKQQARTQALQMVYLTRKLMDPVEPKR